MMPAAPKAGTELKLADVRAADLKPAATEAKGAAPWTPKDSAGRQFRPAGAAGFCEVLGVFAVLIGALVIVGTLAACFVLPTAEALGVAAASSAVGSGCALLAAGALLQAAGAALTEQVRLRRDLLEAFAATRPAPPAPAPVPAAASVPVVTDQ